MKHALFPLALLACSVLAMAQPSGSSYQPAVPAPANVSVNGGWGGYSSPGTVAGSAMSGMSQVISAAGQYNLATSAAAVNMTEARRNDIQNDMMATNAYFEMRATNRSARAAERGPRPSAEQIARLAREGAPKGLTPQQMDPISGTLRWPAVLQMSGFDAQRQAVDPLFAKWAKYGGLDMADQTTVRDSVDSMYDMLKAQIRSLPPADYMAGRTFLQSLVFATSRSDL